MILTILLFFLAFLAEKRWSPRLDYLKEDSILMFFYSAKNERKSIIFKL